MSHPREGKRMRQSRASASVLERAVVEPLLQTAAMGLGCFLQWQAEVIIVSFWLVPNAVLDVSLLSSICICTYSPR